MLVDSHCHLVGSHASPEVEAGLAAGPGPGAAPGPEGGPELPLFIAMLERARRAGVTGFVVVGTDLEDSRRVLDLARRRPDVQACAGLHPHEARRWEPRVAQGLEALLQDPDVRLVGETGLDWHYDHSPRDAQEAVFREHLRLARKVRKPVVVHTREAPAQTLRILREEGADQVGGIIHCFSEDLAFARQALDLGFHLSFSGIVTFRNAAAIQEVAAWAPEDRILVETDSPYLAPVPHRGKPNEPALVTHVAAKVAALRGMAPGRLGEITTHNLEALCGWPPCS